ncbi:MAG: hypothetical protein ACP5M9_01805, partial [Candidatus Micrarchaeia archaeon]
VIKKFSNSDTSELITRISQNNSIELHVLIREFIKLTQNRLLILSELRALGIKEKDIADSFAYALQECSYEV